eukprot:403333595
MIYDTLQLNKNGSPERNNKLKIYDYEQILDRVGGFGKFQVIGVAMSIISFITEGCLIYSFSFLTLMPDYLCNDDGLSTPYHCQKAQTCTYPNQDMLSMSDIQNTPGFTINWNNQTSLYNLVEELNLRCAENWEIGFLGSCYFMGAVFGNLFLSRLGDTIGRISMIRVGISLSMIIYVLFLFLSTSIVINYFLMFLFGSLTSLRVSVSYLYGQEIVKSKHSNMIGSLYIGIHLFFLVLILASAMTSFYLPESPKFLISTKKYKQARQSLNRIAQVNGVKLLDGHLEQIKDEVLMNKRRRHRQIQAEIVRRAQTEQQNRTVDSLLSQAVPNHSIYNLIQNRLYLLNLVLMSITWASSTFTYYMVGFYIKYIPGDIFNMVIVSCMAELIACLVSGMISSHVGTQKCLFTSFLLGGLFGISIIFIDRENTIMISICLLLTKFGVSSAFNLCFLVTAEYFPTLYSSTVFGACNVFARIMSIFSPLIAEVAAPVPMIVYTCFCFMSMLGTTLLVKHEDTDNIIDDILSKSSYPNKRERDFDQEYD